MGKARVSHVRRAVWAALGSADARIRVTAVRRTVWGPLETDTTSSRAGVALTYPGADTNSDPIGVRVTRRNRLSGTFYVPGGTSITIHCVTKPSDGNLGVCRIDNGDDHFAAAPANGTDYTYTLLGGYYFVYSFNASSYRGGLTGAGTFDLTGAMPVGAGVTQVRRTVWASFGDGSARVTQVRRIVWAIDTTPDPTGGGPTGSPQKASGWWT